MSGRACTKRRYRDEAAAELALARIAEAGDAREKTPQRVYRCPRCRGWHLTSWPATLPESPPGPVTGAPHPLPAGGGPHASPARPA